ncbi:MAG: YqzL family protein [Clostridia bacterium]|nr:YqzL family protein [Clostridia bacterium]
MLRDELWNYFESTGSIETYLLYKTMEEYKVETSKELSQILDSNPLNKNLN